MKMATFLNYSVLNSFLDDIIWAVLTWCLILLPGIGVGFNEILRQPLPNNILRDIEKQISRDITRTEASDTKHKPRRYLSFNHLSFGLDVLPGFILKIPDNICIKLLVIIPYVAFMALWFPFLPFIQ